LFHSSPASLFVLSYEVGVRVVVLLLVVLSDTATLFFYVPDGCRVCVCVSFCAVCLFSNVRVSRCEGMLIW
jgi:hypothetical protein